MWGEGTDYLFLCLDVFEHVCVLLCKFSTRSFVARLKLKFYPYELRFHLLGVAKEMEDLFGVEEVVLAFTVCRERLALRSRKRLICLSFKRRRRHHRSLFASWFLGLLRETLPSRHYCC